MKGINITVRFRNVYDRFLKLQGDPHEIAMGLALGVMVGMSPLFFFHTIIAIFFAAVLKCSKITAVLGVQITNFFTAPFIYPVTYLVGHAVLGASNLSDIGSFHSMAAIVTLIRESPLIFIDLIMGGIVLGLPVAVAAYRISLKMSRN